MPSKRVWFPRGLSGQSSDAGVVLKLSSDGTTAIDATYFGGSIPQAAGGTDIHGIALDAAGNVTIAGASGAADLP